MRLRRRVAFACLVVLTAVVLAAGRGLATTSAWLLHDDFLDTRQVDLTTTTARIDTTSPGLVTLPSNPVGLAWSKEKNLLVATGSGIQGFRHSSDGMSSAPDLGINWPAFGVSWFADAKVAACNATEVRVYAGGQLVQSIGGFTDLRGLAPAGSDLWVLGKSTAWMYRWDGAQLRLWLTVNGLNDARSISYQDAWKALLIVQPDAARVFRSTTDGVQEDPNAKVALSGALGGAWREKGAAYFVLFPDRVELHGVGSDKTSSYPVPSGPLTLANLGNDYSVVAGTAVLSFDFGQSLPWYSVNGLQGITYVTSAWLYSKVFAVDHQITQMRLMVGQTLPANTGTAYDVSTDGGTTWTPLPPDTIVQVPGGQSIVYRAQLWTKDPAVTPEIDWVDLSEIVTVTQQVSPVYVKLIQ